MGWHLINESKTEGDSRWFVKFRDDGLMIDFDQQNLKFLSMSSRKLPKLLFLVEVACSKIKRDLSIL